MGHTTAKGYLDLQRRLDLSPQGAPASETLFAILEALFSEDEARLVSKLPLSPFTASRAAKRWKLSTGEAEGILSVLADKGIILDYKNGDTGCYVLAPTMAGFFEFSLMRTDGKFDAKLLSELYHTYIGIEEKFIKEVLALDPPIDRVFVQEGALADRAELVILDYERASSVIENASVITVGRCYCRHKQEHLGIACNNPQDVCLTFNDTADSLSRHGIARRITNQQARQILTRSIDLGLVQIGDNVQQKVNWICNCCSCCCEAIRAYTRLGAAPKINSNFAPYIHEDDCTGCGACVKRCPVGAASLAESTKKKNRARIDGSVCIGCGVCVRFCAPGALVMERREETTFVPVDSFERVLLSAIDAGKLGNFISDNFDLLSPTLMRRMVGLILRMGPIKRRLVDRQIASRYLTAMTRLYYRINPDQFDGLPPDYSHPEIYRR